MNAVKEAPDYLHDEHLSQGTKTYLNVLNGGGPAVESLPVPDARRVLADSQAAVRSICRASKSPSGPSRARGAPCA